MIKQKGFVVVTINKKTGIYEAELDFVEGDKYNARFYYRLELDNGLSLWNSGRAAVEWGQTAFSTKEEAFNAANRILNERFLKKYKSGSTFVL